MEDCCFAAKDLDELLDLSPEDPRLAHLESCSACRTLLKSYRQFLSLDSSQREHRTEKAGRELSRFLENWVDEAGEPSGKVPEHHPFLNRLMEFLRGPVLAPVLAVMALLLATTMFFTTRDGLPPERLSGIERGSSDQKTTHLIEQEATVLASGGIQLTWQLLPDADSYRILLLAEDLRILRDIELGSVDRFNVDAGVGAHYWRVIANSRGDEVGRSELRSLPQRP